jgi:hypothetical protein
VKRLDVDVSDGIAGLMQHFAALSESTVGEQILVALSAYILHRIAMGDLGPAIRSMLSNAEADLWITMETVADLFVDEARGLPDPPLLRRRTNGRQAVGFAPSRRKTKG